MVFCEKSISESNTEKRIMGCKNTGRRQRMKRKMIVILVCFSLIFGTLIDASKVQAASIEISGIYVRMENISVGDLSTGNYIAKVISRKRLSVNKRYMGEIYRRIPTIYYSLSNTTGYGISIGVYVKRESGYHLVDYNLIDDGMWRSGKFNELNLKPKELEKGKSLDLKVVAVDIQGVANKKIKYITYTIPTKLNRAYVDTYKKGNVVVDLSQDYIGNSSIIARRNMRTERKMAKIEEVFGLNNVLKVLCPSDLADISRYPSFNDKLGLTFQFRTNILQFA